MGRKVNIAVLGSTNGTDMQALMDAIKSKKLEAEIVLVASDKIDSGIMKRATNNSIQTFFIDYKNYKTREDAEASLIPELKSRGTDLVLLIGFMKIVTPTLINEFKGRMWNIHPSLLPKYAGGMNLDVHKAVLAAMEKETGCTLHEVATELDGGKIIMQKSCKIDPSDTPETLKVKVQALEQQCLIESINNFSKKQ